MDRYIDEDFTDEDREYLARRERRRRHMRQQRRRRRRRRRILKMILRLLVLVVLIIVLVVVVKAVQKQETHEEQPQVQTESSMEGADSQETEESIEQGDSPEPKESAGQTDSSEPVRMSEDETVESQASVAEQKKETPVYKFESTSETATIYSENVISTNAILIDESTDTIVAAKGAKERLSPASMTKVLTVLVAAEHITEEELDDTFTMTREITDYSYVNDCSSVGFLDGEEITVRDLFYGTVLPSGGDAAVGLATYVAGSHESFVDLMNEKLKELGLGDSAHFTNCVGLYDENHYCTLYDMAVIMKAAMQNEMCREFLSAHSYTTTPTAQHPEGITISNWFLRRIEDKDTGGEVLCAKTGYVVQSQNCAVSYGTFAGGTPYICVTAGSTSSWRCIYDHVEIYTRYVPTE